MVFEASFGFSGVSPLEASVRLLQSSGSRRGGVYSFAAHAQWIDGGMDARAVDGWMDGAMNGWMDGCMLS